MLIRRIPWEDVTAVHAAGRWESLSTATRRDGTRVNLYGTPAEAALRLHEALAQLSDHQSTSSGPTRPDPPSSAAATVGTATAAAG